MPDLQPKLKAKNQLTDIDVKTVGLVPQGANRQKFFLLKNLQEVKMTQDNLNIEEVEEAAENATESTEETAPGWFTSKMDDLVKMFQSDEAENEEGDASDSTEDVEKDAADNEDSEVGEPAPINVENEDVAKLLKQQHEQMTDFFEKQTTGIMAEVQKATKRAEAAEAKVADLQKVSDANLEKAEKQELLQKSLEYKAMPKAPKDVAEMLYTLKKKLDPAEFETVEGTFTALDKAAWLGGVMSEFGTTRTTEEAELEAKITKAAESKDITYEDALLSLRKEEQVELLKKWGEDENG